MKHLYPNQPTIHGLTCCVGYAHLFSASLSRWMCGMHSLTVVTTPDDYLTHGLCERAASEFRATFGYDYDLRLVKTDAFTQDGAAFNKGRAMEEARQRMPWQDWILFFDADILPQFDWAGNLGPLLYGRLHGAWRRQVPEPLVQAVTTLTYDPAVHRLDDPTFPRIEDDRVGYGYFQLFHSTDPVVRYKLSLLDTHWTHAGNYDSNFMLSWGANGIAEMPVDLFHLGGKHENWFGVGQEERFRQMQATRAGQGIHPSEKV